MVDRGVTFGDLKGALILAQVFRPWPGVRFRLTSSPSPNPGSRWTSSASSAAATAAGSAGHGVAGDPWRRHGRSRGLQGRRLRPRGLQRLRLRHGPRAHRHAQVRGQRPARCSSKTTSGSCGSSHQGCLRLADQYLRAARCRLPKALARGCSPAPGLEVEGGMEPLGAGLHPRGGQGEVREERAAPRLDHPLPCTRVCNSAPPPQVIPAPQRGTADAARRWRPQGPRCPATSASRCAQIRAVNQAGVISPAGGYGLSEEHGGILDLCRRARIGTGLARHSAAPDTSWRAAAAPTRPDAPLDALGITREVAAPRPRAGGAATSVAEKVRAQSPRPPS